MNWNDALTVVYNYRLNPDPSVAAPLFEYTRKSGLLLDPQSATGWAGVITGIYDRHKPQQQLWKGLHNEVIDRAFRIARHHKTPNEVTYADYLTFRWFMLGTDREAWDLLLRAHHRDVELAKGAQACIEKICMGTLIVDRNGAPRLDSQNTAQGHVEFPDMRQQILDLNGEFRLMTWSQRHLPFSMLPFSPAYRLKQRELAQFVLSSPGLIQ